MATENTIEPIVETEAPVESKAESPVEMAVETETPIESKDEPPVESVIESEPDPAPETPTEHPENIQPAEEKAPEPESVIEVVAENTVPEARSLEQLSDSLSQILITTLDTVKKNLVDHIQSSMIEESASEDAKEPPVVQEVATAASHSAFSVPHPRNPDFVGRISALSQLFGMWNPGQTSQARIAIVGLGGIGYVDSNPCHGTSC